MRLRTNGAGSTLYTTPISTESGEGQSLSNPQLLRMSREKVLQTVAPHMISTDHVSMPRMEPQESHP